jgi:transposase
LRASFIPDKEQRDLRDLLRYRKSKIEERARELNRLQKFLEGANIKLAGVISDIGGKTGKRLLSLVTSGDEVNLESVSECRDASIRASAEDLLISVEGIVSPLQRALIGAVLDNIAALDSQIDHLYNLVETHMGEAYARAAKTLSAIPGIGIASAQVIVGEIGIDMSRFPNEHHLSSWAGLAPGNNESAGKSKSGRTNRANKTIKTTLTQCAHIACRNKDSFFYAQYQRLVVRRGKKKAVVAVAHSMLIAIYHVLSGKQFEDLGAGYYTQFNTQRKIQSYLRQLEKLGWKPPDIDLPA